MNKEAADVAHSNPALRQGFVNWLAFKDYLLSKNCNNNRATTKVRLCYAKRFAHVLLEEDASDLIAIESEQKRLNIMKSLTLLSKFLGYYDNWLALRKRYNLKWTAGNESVKALQRFFNPNLTLESMLQQIRQMIANTPPLMGNIIKFGVLTGLRPGEVVESVRLLVKNVEDNISNHQYYNPERQTLEHFRFPEIFLRQTKKAYISFVTPSMIEPLSKYLPKGIPTYNALRLTCQRKGIKCDFRYTRKIFASYLRQEGIQPEVVDMLQGRVSQSVLTRHYLAPSNDLKDKVLSALDRLSNKL